jgi:TRAP-type C4-dicarboxylate transport system substrate-binding protein
MSDKTKNATSVGVSRREALRMAGRYGCAVASVSLGFLSARGGLSVAEAAENEQAKKAAAKYILTAGLDGTLNLTPGRKVTEDSMWIYGIRKFKDLIETNSKGQIYVDVHDAGALGSQTTALKKVQQGIIQAASCSTQNAAQLVPIWNVIDPPYTIGTIENAWKVVFSKEFNDAVRKVSDRQRLTLSFTLPYLRYLELSRNVSKEIRKPEDLAGLKMRVTGSKFEQVAFQILPANPTPIAWSELFTALKDGAVDGAHVTPTSVLDGGMAPVIGQIVDTSFMFNCDSIFLNTAWLDRLPADLRDVVMQASFEAQKQVHDDFNAILRDVAGVEPDSPKVGWRATDTKIVRLTDSERAAWKDFLSVERNKAVLNPLIDQFGRKEYELVKELVAQPGPAKPKPWWQA